MSESKAGTTSSGLAAELLVLPISGAPLIFEQLEKHLYRLDDGTFAIKFSIMGRNYRDSNGRLLRESEVKDSSGNIVPSHNILTDTVSGSQIVLMHAGRIAVRMPMPVSGEPQFSFSASPGSSHERSLMWEDAGRRTIEGVEFVGSRMLQTAKDDLRLPHTAERWYCDELKLIGAVAVSGPEEAYSIKIQNLRREEPDIKVFEIPTDYTFVEAQ